MSPRVIFSEQFYYPEGWGGAQIPRDITMHLARSGFEVEVICGSDPYSPPEGDAGVDPSSVGVRIRRTVRLLGGDVHRHKLLRQLWFCLASLPRMLGARAPSLFVTQTNPPLIVPMTACVAAVRRRPFVIIAQDLYPEVMVAHGMLARTSLVARLLGAVFGWAYRRAARVISLGPVMSRRLQQKGVREQSITEICNWATGDEGIVRGAQNRLRQDWGLQDRFVLLYSGNLGIAHDVRTPILALQALRAELPQLTLLFVGKGSRLQEARELAERAGVADAVQFRPLVPADLLPHSLGLADLALVTLLPGFEGLVVPSKLLGYMARGVPTLYVGPASDAQELVEASGGGVAARNGDLEHLVAVLRELVRQPERLAAMSRSAEQYYARQLARPLGLEQYRRVCEQVGKLSPA